MSKVAVVYWSGTGNTEAMANAVADGIQSKGAEAAMLGPSDFTKDMVADSAAPPWVLSSLRKQSISRCGMM